jgi:hypothetical protein
MGQTAYLLDKYRNPHFEKPAQLGSANVALFTLSESPGESTYRFSFPVLSPYHQLVYGVT